MALEEADRMSIDQAARIDWEKYLNDSNDKVDATEPGAVNLLNALRAYWMLMHLGLAETSQERAEAAIRENWPEEWYPGEHDETPREAYLRRLAVRGLFQHQLRKDDMARRKAAARNT